MQIQLQDADLRAAISEAILSQITPEAREAMIKEALAKVIEPKKDDYGRVGGGGSVVQRAFSEECATLAQQVVHKLVTEDLQIRSRIEDMVLEYVTTTLGDDDTRRFIVKTFAEAFSKSIARLEREY